MGFPCVLWCARQRGDFFFADHPPQGLSDKHPGLHRPRRKPVSAASTHRITRRLFIPSHVGRVDGSEDPDLRHE